MLVPAADAQSLKKGHRSAGAHLKGSTKELQPSEAGAGAVQPGEEQAPG